MSLTAEQRTERASKAGRASAAVRGSADYHLRKLKESSAELTDKQRAELAEIIRPVLGRGGRRSRG